MIIQQPVKAQFAPRIILSACFAALSLSSHVMAGCSMEEGDSEAFDESRSVAEVEVVSVDPFESQDGTIQTRITLRTVERFKGDVPDRVMITTPGGELNGRRDFRSDSLPLELGKSYVLLLNQAENGTWSARPHRAYRAIARRGNAGKFFRNHARGARPELIPASAPEVGTAEGNAGVPSSVVTPTGYSETNNQPTRFVTCDGDEPIPYLIDIDPTKLPTGMNQAGAVAAVAEALNAWAGSSSLKFKYDGTVSFGVASSAVTTQDRRLRIQLHDNYNIINTNGVLGIGGGSFTVGSTTLTGGRVGTQGFQERLYGYVVIESTTNNSFLLNTNNFKRVLTHEIGHSLGLEHSSNNASEPNAILKAATMYYTAAAGSAGATLNAYDVDRIQFGYPVTNTPPFVVDRILRAVTRRNTSGTLPTTLGTNRLQLRTFDRQGGTLTPSLAAGSSAKFSISGNVLVYAPTDFSTGAPLTDSQIIAGSSYDVANVQISDGVNLSRVARYTVVEIAGDSTPSDGLGDTWMTTYFGSTVVGAVGASRHPDSDPDKDGLTNRVEFFLNTNPNSAASGPGKPVYNPATRQLTWTALPFTNYWVESSTNLSTWSLRGMNTLYASSGSLTRTFSGTAPTREFYRLVIGP